jgi:hypothetical protein
MPSAIMYKQFGFLGPQSPQIAYLRKRYVTFCHQMPLPTYWHELGRVGILSYMRELAPEPSSSTHKSASTMKCNLAAQKKQGFLSRLKILSRLHPHTPSSHHHISRDVRSKFNLLAWLGNHQDDPVLEVGVRSPPSRIKGSTNTLLCPCFVPHLKEHLLHRLISDDSFHTDETSITARERNMIIFINNRIFKHKALRMNYTTYNLRHAQDSLSSRTHADFMTLPCESDIHPESTSSCFPYRFGRIIGIFHTMVLYN